MNECRLKAIIVDDELFCIKSLEAALTPYPEIEIIGRAANIRDAKHLIMCKQPDLLFLDVELPDENGLEMLSGIADRIQWNMQVIFCTAHGNYMLNAFRTGAFDFLLKPYDQQEFDLVMQRFYKNKNNSRTYSISKDIVHSELIKKQFLFVNTALGIEKFEINNIIFFEYDKTCRTWYAHDVSEKKIALKRGTTATDIESISECLIQANQYQLINIRYISSITFDNKCILVPPFKYEFCISRRYRKDFYDRIAML